MMKIAVLILTALAVAIVAAMTSTDNASADCVRLDYSHPNSPCRSHDLDDFDFRIRFDVDRDEHECTASIVVEDAPDTWGIRFIKHNSSGQVSYGSYSAFNPDRNSRSYSVAEAFDLKAMLDDGAHHRVDAQYGLNGLALPARHSALKGRFAAIVVGHFTETWRNNDYSYILQKEIPINDNLFLSNVVNEIYECGLELDNALFEKEEARLLAEEKRRIAAEEMARRMVMAQNLLAETNALKKEQAKLASELKLQEEETRTTLQIVEIQRGITKTRIAIQEARLAGLEARAEIIRQGAHANNEMMQEFLLQSGSRYEAIETKQAEIRQLLEDSRNALAELERRYEETLKAQQAILDDLTNQVEEKQAQIDALQADQ